MHFFIYISGLIVFLFIAVFIISLRNLIGSRLKKPTIELRPCEELPPFLNELFKPAGEQLHSMGFQQLQCILRDQFISHSLSKKWSILYGNKAESAYAEVSFTSSQTEMPGYEISFSTIYDDDTLLQTLNCRKHGIAVEIPKVIFIDPYAQNLEDQWKTHRQKANELKRSKKAFSISPVLYVARHQIVGNQNIDELITKGIIKEAEKGEYSFNLMRSIPLTIRLIKGELKATRVYQASKKKDTSFVQNIPIEADVEAYQLVESINRKRPIGRLGKTIVLLVSAMLFSASFGVIFSFRTVLFLLGAVMFHELGHFLGMRLFGYKNLQILFVPFMGALAYGKEKDTKPYQRVIVLLLGPLPGIIVGFIGLFLFSRFHEQWLFELSTLMLVLNFINLIPLMPLDGGQLIQTLLFQRFPRIKAVFHIFSAVIFGLLAMAINDPVLYILCFFMLLSVPVQWRQGKALVHMKNTIREHLTDERARLLRFFQALREKPFGKMSFANKIGVVKLAERELKISPASWKLIVVSLLIYGITIVSPLGIFFVGAGMMVAENYQDNYYSDSASDWDAQIAKTPTAEEKWDLLMEAGNWHRDYLDDENAKRYFQQSLDLARTFGEDDLRVAKSTIALASYKDSETARQLYEKALLIQEKHLGPNHLDISETLQLIADTQNEHESIPTLERRLIILQNVKGENDFETTQTLRELALKYDCIGNDEKAEQYMRHCLTILKIHNKLNEQPDFLIDLGVYYAVKGNYDEAERLLNEGLTTTESSEIQNHYWHNTFIEEIGWVKLAQGKGEDAIVHFKKALENRRAFLKKSVSYKELGFLNYLIMKIINFTTGGSKIFYSEESGASLSDVPLLLDISYACLTVENQKEAERYFDEANQIIKTYGNGMESILMSENPNWESQQDEKTDFLSSWTLMKKQTQVKAKAILSDKNTNMNNDQSKLK